MPIVNCISMNLVVIATAFLLTYRVLRFRGVIDSMVFWFLAYLGQIILTELFLGVLGKLYFNNLILLNLAVFLGVWLCARRLPSSWDITAVPARLGPLAHNNIARLGISILAGFFLVKIAVNLVNPPFGWDSLNYHFVFPVEWMKHGNLDTPITVSDDPSPSYYPLNGSLYFLWLIFPLKSVFMADLGQVPFFIVAFLTAYWLARRLGVQKQQSLYAALLFLLIPNLFKQLKIAYVDVMVAALFLACINYIFSLQKEYSPRNMLACAVSFGLLIGTKTVALPYGLLLLPLLIFLGLGHIRKWQVTVAGIVVIFLLGGFSYARNFIQTQNPLYPLELKLFGRELFKGVIDVVTYRAHFKPGDYALGKLLLHEGLGAQTLLLALPAALLTLPVALLKKRKELDFTAGYVMLLPLLLYLVYRFVIPLPNTRYLYPLLGVALVCAFYLLQVLRMPAPVLRTLVVLCFITSVPELAKRLELVASAVLSAGIFFAFPGVLRYAAGAPVRAIREKRLFALALCVFLAFCLHVLSQDYTRKEYDRYKKMAGYSGFWPDALDAWKWLNSHTSGNTIAYVGRPVALPLYGTYFKNNVFYVSVNRVEPAKLHYFPRSYYRWGFDFSEEHKDFEKEGNYRGAADYAVWRGNLLKAHAEYLFVYSLHQTRTLEFPLEDSWARAHPEAFVPVFTNHTMHIYRIKT